MLEIRVIIQKNKIINKQRQKLVLLVYESRCRTLSRWKRGVLGKTKSSLP